MLDTVQLREELRKRLSAPAWALLEEVGNGTGAKLTSYADAVAMSLWPSHKYGGELHGFEIKASRADWLNELKQPEKWEAVGRYCDRWWLVIASQDMVQPGELPSNWGLLVPTPSQLTMVTEAPLMPSAPWDRQFMSAVMRRVTESSATAAELQARYDNGCKDGWRLAENAQPNLKRFRRRAQQALEDARRILNGEEAIWRYAPREK